jgi:hypothetical protein
MTYCAVALLEVEAGTEPTLMQGLRKVAGVRFVDRIRGPYQLLVGFTKMEDETLSAVDSLPGVTGTRLLETFNGCPFTPAHV